MHARSIVLYFVMHSAFCIVQYRCVRSQSNSTGTAVPRTRRKVQYVVVSGFNSYRSFGPKGTLNVGCARNLGPAAQTHTHSKFMIARPDFHEVCPVSCMRCAVRTKTTGTRRKVQPFFKVAVVKVPVRQWPILETECRIRGILQPRHDSRTTY